MRDGRWFVVGVLVLNASMEPLHTVSVPHAVRMLVRRVAEIHEAEVGTTFGHYPLPRVVRLVRYVAMKWRYSHPPRWTRRGVLKRDGHRCAYCGRPADTVDHVVPLSRGGARTDWFNTVACCGRCNARKGNRLLDEAGMLLLVTPRAPSWHELYG
jgi:5-methylcytosine-specific restriction endonuclease McrA